MQSLQTIQAMREQQSAENCSDLAALDIAERIESLAVHMAEVAAIMRWNLSTKNASRHADELFGAAFIAREWAEAIRSERKKE
jgi:uncharacterized membrane protein